MMTYMLNEKGIFRLTESGVFWKTVIWQRIPDDGYSSINHNITIKEMKKLFEPEGYIFSNNLQSLLAMRELID